MVIENVFSSVSYAISGVPHDSVLWAGIVLCFYKRCSCYLSWTFSYIKLFADDLNIYYIVDISYPTATLQLSLDQLVNWSAECFRVIIYYDNRT